MARTRTALYTKEGTGEYHTKYSQVYESNAEFRKSIEADGWTVAKVWTRHVHWDEIVGWIKVNG